jgi:hypothetical protein
MAVPLDSAFETLCIAAILYGIRILLETCMPD